ncbi:hypothetical protein K461DRAFT_293061 [Myriangium duriaei CBS 260.36]|uniref:Methyltransferase domain-containing protein n=1 Tax=Myriangium duriaei CBS 260.36 TaxID=1168546 RepID=A0A9P4J8K4_9PEZI|nr:hypothetical protein K461DRAFT_293061 [Myriangium duriaei CBS 260.36]
MTVKRPGWEDRSKDDSFWLHEPPQFSEKAQQVLGKYSKLPRESWEEHVTEIRDQAWQCAPFPCVGMWGFLSFGITGSVEYPEVVDRLKKGQTLLDLGGGLGQDLRALVADGAPSESLTLFDMDEDLWKVGYDLFRDRQDFKAKFIPGDIFKPSQLFHLSEAFDMVFGGNFLHLFDIKEQKEVINTILDLICPRKGSLVFGFQIGTRGEPRMLGGPKGRGYRHTTQSIQDMWKSTAAAKGFEVETAAEGIELHSQPDITQHVDVGGEPLLKLQWSMRVTGLFDPSERTA